MIKRSRLHHVLIALRESAWTAIAAKVVLFVAALLFLAWIGQAATARATTSSRSAAKSGKSRWQWLSISMGGAASRKDQEIPARAQGKRV